MAPRRPEDRERTFEERLRVPTQPGYYVAPVAGWLALVFGSLGAALPSTPLIGVAAGLGALVIATAAPSVFGLVETAVEGGDLYVTLGPEWLSGGEHVRLDAERIATVAVVESPVSEPPTDADGDPLPGFDGDGRNTWPEASVGIPDRPGVVIRVEDGPAPEFPVVVPGEGVRGAFSAGRGPPGFVPSDRPEDLRAALAAAKPGSAEDSNPARRPRTPDRSGTADDGTPDRSKTAEPEERGR